MQDHGDGLCRGDKDRHRSSRRTETHLLNERGVFSAAVVSRQILIGMDGPVVVAVGGTLVYQRGMPGWRGGVEMSWDGKEGAAVAGSSAICILKKIDREVAKSIGPQTWVDRRFLGITHVI